MGKGSGTSSISFKINGQEYNVDPLTPNVNSESMLVDFIRDSAHLKGTKVMCREGGCGACVVTVRTKDPATGDDVVKGVNSCLTPVYSCQGYDITTVEGLGNREEGYSLIQNRLVNFHGTQCGFCTPGMVMNMHSLVESKQGAGVTVKEVDDSFDGNLCRCTGYRPILDAFKSLAVDAPEDLKRKCADIEDCASCPCPLRKGQACSKGKGEEKSNVTLQLANGSEWITAVDLWAVFQAIQRFNNDGKKFRFVAGNTATGVYKNEGPYTGYLEITGVPELKQTKIDSTEVVLGGGTTLSHAIVLLAKASLEKGFEYTKQMSTHLERVANVPVRNNASIAGNLMIKHAHNEFPSDVFVILETVGAKVNIASGVTDSKKVSVLEFLKTDMKDKIILSVHLPPLAGGYHLRTFKITRRYQNSHAYVNAGLLFKVDPSKNHLLLERPRLVFGGINPDFTHAYATEEFLGKNPELGDEKVLQSALNVLEKEVTPDIRPPEADPVYRRSLAKSLLYKAVLRIIEGKVSSTIKSGGTDIPREISKGKQEFEVDKSAANLYKEIPKIEGGWQASGEAEYVPDIPKVAEELFGVFVQSTIACGTLKSIDASEALEIPGVVKFISAKDIRGTNNYMCFNFFPVVTVEPVFVADKISHYGQPVGLIVAKNRAIAISAAKKVKINYDNVDKPVVNIADAVEKAEKAGNLAQHYIGTFKSKPDSSVEIKHTLKGEFQVGSQYHFYMETQNCLCIPKEDSYELFSSTQWMDHTQNVVSAVLGVPSNSINMQVRRIGGAFGGKATRPAHIAAAAAVAAQSTQKPVRVLLDLEANMNIIGKRNPYLLRYEVGFNDSGKIGSFKTEIFCDPGFSPNDATSFTAAMHIQNVYKAIGWEVKPGVITTNTPANTFTRAPGSIQSTALIENVMEHMSHYLKKDSLAVREINFLEKGDALLPTMFGESNFETDNLMPLLINEMKSSAEYEKRKAFVDTFNQENRWKKRGLAMVPVRYPIDYNFGCNLPATIAIYHFDGHVACTHAGIEMGQGLNTKVIQTIANSLQIPMDKIKIKPSNNFIGANAFPTAGSLGSELVCHAVLKACETIKARLKPILEKMENPNWEKLIAEAHNSKIDLTASHTPSPRDDLKSYDIWVLALTETEIDVLTGEYKVVRTDVIEDAGKSLSPGVDLGQIEGGYIFGQGLWTTEKIVHCPETGELLTNRTWDYKVPETKDIPEDLRITLLKNAPNPTGILRSKATGEPVLCSSVSVMFALRNAIAAARKDTGNSDWFRMDGPVTPEDVYKYCLTSSKDFIYTKN